MIPTTSPETAIVAVGATATAAIVDSYLGKELAVVILVVAGAFIGATGGCIASSSRGVSLAIRGIFAFVAGLFSSFFMLSGFVNIPPALLCAVVAFVAVEPKTNIDAALSLLDRVRGKNGVSQ